MNNLQSFQYTQGKLQDFLECKRRFYLRYIHQLVWPAVESQPLKENEILRIKGTTFHKMIHQYFLGMPAEKLSMYAREEPLNSWWKNFQTSIMTNPLLLDTESKKIPEYALAAFLGSNRLQAKFDLVIVNNNNLYIFDWKTSNRLPKKDWLEKRMQTRVYTLVGYQSSGYISANKLTLPAENIHMIYWFANFPDSFIQFDYSASQYIKDNQFLQTLVDNIKSLQSFGEDSFSLTTEEKNCLFCTYRSLCNRGTKAADRYNNKDYIESDYTELDLDMAEEIEF